MSDFRGLSLEHLRVVAAVERAGSMTKAPREEEAILARRADRTEAIRQFPLANRLTLPPAPDLFPAQ